VKKEKAFWIAVLSAFVVLTGGDILIHQFWLKETYQGLAQYWRPEVEMKEKMWLAFLAAFSLAFLLAHIYPKGIETKSPVGEGLRFGVLMGLLLYLPSVLVKYYVYPYPDTLFLKWFVGGVAQVTAAGLVIALAYGKK